MTTMSIHMQKFPDDVQQLVIDNIFEKCLPNEIDKLIKNMIKNGNQYANKENTYCLLEMLKKLIELSMFNNNMVKQTIKRIFPHMSKYDLREYTVKDLIIFVKTNILSEDNTILNMLYELIDGFSYIFVTYMIEDKEKIICINYTPYEYNLRWKIELVYIDGDNINKSILNKTMYRYDFYKEQEYGHDERNNMLNLMINMYDLLFNVIPTEMNIKKEFHIKLIDMYEEPNYEYGNMLENETETCDLKDEYMQLKKEEWITLKTIYKKPIYI